MLRGKLKRYTYNRETCTGLGNGGLHVVNKLPVMLNRGSFSLSYYRGIELDS